MIVERSIGRFDLPCVGNHRMRGATPLVIQCAAALAIFFAITSPASADTSSESVASITGSGAQRGITGSGAQRGITGSGAQRGITGSGAQRGVNGTGSFELVSLSGVQLSGTILAVDERLGVASVDGHEVFIGSANVEGNLAIGVAVIVYGVSSLDGSLVLADEVTVLGGASDIDVSDLY